MAIPSGYSSLGLIGFTDKGDYNAETNYVQNDLCHDGGKIWKCKLDNTIGQTPAEGTYWTVFVDPTSSVSEMEDVTLTDLADGQELTYDATASKWKNTSEISNVKQALSDEVETRATLGAHNLLDILGSTKGNVSVSASGVITNTATDTKSALSLVFKFFYADGTNASVIWQDITGTGAKTFTVTAAKDIVEWSFVHNGSVRNFSLNNKIPLSAGKYIITFSITSNDPTTVGGLVIQDLMMRKEEDSDTTYRPFAMTNQQLTDELSVEDASANVTSVDAVFSDIDILKTGKVVQITATIAAGTTAGVKQFKVTKYAPKMTSTCNGVALSDAADAGKVISAQILDSGWAYISLSSTLTDAVKVGFVYITA